MRTLREYLPGALLLLFLSVRYYPGLWGRTVLETLKFLGAVCLYGLSFAFLLQWALKKFFHHPLARRDLLRAALWAAVIMAFGESLRHYLGLY
ncbi:hypothetical protein FVE67_04765 [Thermosulfurimonas marina]|uniref:Uncharacterized protein n=1 Tax=Thermosulfurimonas marina TaxID=2047767 RepID=A0A6H1WSK6_9BACT|nr:hypothetical protein FVE67_04765 [Thermosulfurimonas marina]